ncbi:MAG: nucleotidyltransferase [Fusobacteriaceae bacterium]
MKSVGIVVEYNPFHNGHKHHLKMAREVSGVDVVIGVMSGDYVQRGEPAAFNRWERAEIALKNGVDLIVELPVFYSTQNAEIFAKGAIEILEELRVENVVFGSETSDLKTLEKIVLATESDEYKSIIKNELQDGVAYPRASAIALEKLGIDSNSQSNDILGMEYVRAAQNKRLKLLPIKRIGTGYHSTSIVGEIASATGVRKILKNVENKNIASELNLEMIKNIVPEETYNHLGKIKVESIAELEKFYFLIRYEIINNCKTLIQIQDVEEGLDVRLYECAIKFSNFNDFIANLATKRYTKGRIQRVLIHILLGISKELTSKVKNRDKIPYIRVLGFSENGRNYLKQIKKDREGLPCILTSLSNIRRDLTHEERELIEFNEKASLIYKMISNYEERKIPLMV